MSGGTQLFDNKMSVNFGATLDPYALDNNNNKIDKFNIDNGGSFFRLTSANLTTSWSISSKKGGKKNNNENQNLNNSEDFLPKDLDFANQQFGRNEDKDEDEENKVPSQLY